MRPRALSYEDRLSSTIADISTNAFVSFQELCRALRGAFPVDVLPFLNNAQRSLTEREVRSTIHSPINSMLPEPHPIDFDWRFDSLTARFLASVAMRLGNVLCVGTPTVFEAVYEAGGSALLVDRNPSLLALFVQIDNCSIERVLTSIYQVFLYFRISLFNAAVIDPPWYPQTYERWLARTLPFVQPNGTLFLKL